MAGRWRAGGAGVLRASVAPFLILFAPFLSYVQYQQHGFANPEVALFLGLILGVAVLVGIVSVLSPAFGVVALAGLLTFLVDIQARDPGLKRLGLLFLGLCVVGWLLRRHVHRIVSLMMATLVVSLWVLPAPSAAVAPATAAAAPAPRADLPLVVHVLLDEFIGPEGLPSDLAPPGFKQDLQSFFVDRGFRLFGKAYSEYPTTHWSVPHLVNLVPGGFQRELFAPGPSAGTYRVTRNAYFERMAAIGYAIQVHQPDYLYLCPDETVASCRTYATRSLDVLAEANLPIAAKLSIVAGTFLGQSDAYMRTKEKYRTIRKRLGLPLPAWHWERGIPSSAASMPMFEAVAASLARAPRGSLVFAHILMPHYPYVYDSHCGQRPVGEWMDRSDPEYSDIPNGIINRPEGRAARYASYFQQIACTERKLDELIQAIPPPLRRDAIIIVQGDHGSRISVIDPTTASKKPPAASDLYDMFSTMFAVRAPAIDPGYDMRLAPITALLRTLVESRFTSTAGVAGDATIASVYFMAGGKAPERRTMPGFDAGGHDGVAATSGRVVPLAGRR